MVGHKVVNGLAALAVLAGLLCAGTSTASAANERLDLEIDNAWLLAPDPEEPGNYSGSQLLSPLSDPVVLSAPLDKNGKFTIPADQFRFSVNQSLGELGSIMYGVIAKADIPGTYDVGTGQASMEAQLATRSKGSIPEGGRSCELSGFSATLKTDGSISSAGTPFVGAPFNSDSGSLLGGWEMKMGDLDVDGFDGTGDLACLTENVPDPHAPFNGYFWMSGKANVVDLTRTRLSLKPATKTIQAGRQTFLNLRLENATDKARKIRVSFKSSNRKVTLRKSILFSVPARSTVLPRINVKALKKARGKAKITAMTENLKASSTLTVKPAKKS